MILLILLVFFEIYTNIFEKKNINDPIESCKRCIYFVFFVECNGYHILDFLFVIFKWKSIFLNIRFRICKL